MQNVPVLIVGGGPVGLSMALALARQNVKSIVIEREPQFTNHPKARGLNVRTMELFSQWGNAKELLNHELSKESRRFIWVRGSSPEPAKFPDCFCSPLIFLNHQGKHC